MKIGIDYREATRPQRTGIGNYAFLLARTLQEIDHENEYVMLSPERGVPLWSSHISFANEIKKAKVDVFHGTANVLPMGVRGGKGIKLVLTIHDLAIYKHPKWFVRRQWFAKRMVVPRSIRIADHIIVPSESTKQDVMELFKLAEKKITVIPHGVEERFFGDHDPRGYILFVGTREPRKNLTGLMAAFEGLPAEIQKGHKLVITGDQGYVPDEELPALYRGASLLVYPSFYEGFGLPVLEAMAAGVPVITSRQVAGNIPGFPGVAVNPDSVRDIQTAITDLIRDDARMSQISAAGAEVARQFTWKRTARAALEIYKS